MKDSVQHKGYMIFLNDESFIRWVLLPNDEDDKYWKEYIKVHPDLEDSFEIAVKILSKVVVKGDKLNQLEKDNLQKSINDFSSNVLKKKRYNLIRKYIAAASILLIIGFSLMYKYLLPQQSEDNLIIGIEQEAENIQLITGSSKNIYGNNLQLKVNENGEILVKNEVGDNITTLKNDKQELNQIIVPYGKQSSLILADGTKIWLGPGTSLSFPNKFNKKTREVYLNGEIYLDVVENHSKPFIVHTSDEIKIQVYGTIFNVDNHPNSEYNVVLVEGSIGLKKSGLEEMRMQPNERVIYKNNIFMKEKVDASKYITWKDNYFVFENTPLSEVLTRIERYYNVLFNIPKESRLTNITCTGKIHLSSDFKNVMKTISILSSLQFKQDGKNVYLELK